MLCNSFPLCENPNVKFSSKETLILYIDLNFLPCGVLFIWRYLFVFCDIVKKTHR